MSKKIQICGLEIDNFTYEDLLTVIRSKINSNDKTLISYANANTINLTYNNKALRKLLNEFSYIHPDGAGIYFASKFLYGNAGLNERITGSDFYPMLAENAISNNWRIFFFGHDNETLDKTRKTYPGLNICGKHNGYNYNNSEVISEINSAKPDILIIGLSFPVQEKWITEHKEKLNFKVCLCVGDGIKVFAGSKLRGPKIIQKVGLEWVIRLLRNPFRYFKRYVIGNPLFLYRIILLKIRKFKG